MSTPQCPKCKAMLNDDYGMMPCPSCGTPVFIDMDGMAHIAEETRQKPAESRLAAVTKTAAEFEIPRLDESLAPEPTYAGDGYLAQPEPPIAVEPPSAPTSEDFSPIAFDLGGMSDEPAATPAPAPAVEPEYAAMAPMGDFGSEASTPEPTPEPAFEPPPMPIAEESAHLQPDPNFSHENGELNMDAILGFQPPPSSSDAEAPVPDFGPPGDPLGLNGYANSEMSQGQDGYLLFKILISGIDSKEMRQSIREVIEDSRFAWDPSELMSRVSKGVLQIDKVPPVKAVILINRIKRLPLQIRWEQSDIRQMDGDAE